MFDHGFRQADRPFATALADAYRAFQGINFQQVDMAHAAFIIARAALPHSLHLDNVGHARLAYAWMAACNQGGVLNPADKLVSMAARATDAEVAFVCQNASLAEILPPRAENLPQPAMSAVA